MALRNTQALLTTRLKLPQNSEALEELISLQNEYSVALRNLQKQERRLQDLTTKLSRLHNYSLPIFRCPPEILSKIFFLACKLEGIHCGRGRWDYRDDITVANRIDAIDPDRVRLPFELRICHVCHYWKEIAEETYTLWQTIVLPRYGSGYPLKSYPQRSFDFERHYIRRYIQHSKTGMLSIRIHLTLFDLWHEIWPILRPVVHRWKRLSISIGDWIVTRTLWPLLNDLHGLYAPMLQDLCIMNAMEDLGSDVDSEWDTDFDLKEVDNDPEEEESMSISARKKMRHPRRWAQRQHQGVIFQAGAPQLRSLRLEGAALVVGCTEHWPPVRGLQIQIMESLTTLFLNAFIHIAWPMDECELILLFASCPSLQSLSIEGDIRRIINREPPKLVALHSLKAIRFIAVPCTLEDDHNYEDQVVWGFFIMFEAPRLESITFVQFDFERYNARDLSFLRHLPSVQVVRIEDSMFDTYAMRLLQEKCDNIRRIDLVYTSRGQAARERRWKKMTPYNPARAANTTLEAVFGHFASDDVLEYQEIRFWADSPMHFDLLKLRHYLHHWARRAGAVTARISDNPRGMTKWLLKGCVENFITLDKLDRPAVWPWWDEVFTGGE